MKTHNQLQKQETSRINNAQPLSLVRDNNEYATAVSHRDRMQKILSALYMLTSLLDTHDPLGLTIRQKGTEALILINNYIPVFNKKTQLLNEFYYKLNELNSYIDVAHKNNFFSDMNYNVIHNELIHFSNEIVTRVQNNNTDDRHISSITNLFKDHKASGYGESTPTTNRDNDFSANAPENRVKEKNSESDNNNNNNNVSESIKDTPVFVAKSTEPKKVQIRNFIKKTPVPIRKKAVRKPKSNEAKELRKENILKILKQKKDASINDICLLFKDCSSKTIQRDLIELIDENKVIKEGSRRWSTYNLA